MSLLNTEQSKLVFDDPRLPEPKAVWNYFLALVETPRGSGHQDIIKPKLIEFGKALGLEAYSDDIGNVIIRKPASAGYENSPGVCLQAHYDIVAVKLENIVHNFLTDPLKPRLLPSPNEKYGKTVLQATGTSLGADDGIGVATIFAILADKTAKHGPLEVLITTDEETTMVGAQNLKPGVLKSQYLLNLDHHRSWCICIGCSGGFENTLRFPLAKTSFDGIRIAIQLKGLKGGHSAGEINKGRANALKVLAEAIHEARRISGTQNSLALQLFIGGDKRNVIPFSGRASLIVPTDKKSAFLDSFKEVTKKLQKEWQTIEPGLEISTEVESEGKTHVGYDVQSTTKALDLIHVLPHGVLRLSADLKDTVQTSINLAKVTLPDGEDEKAEISMQFLARSSDRGQWDFVHQRLAAVARIGGGRCDEMSNSFPAWLPEPNSPLVQLAKQVFKEINHTEAEIFATHGGLECGQFIETYPHLKCISVGPYYTGMHSTDETLYVDTVPGTYRLVTGILEKLKE